MNPFAPSTGPLVSWEVDNHHFCCQDLHMNPRRRFVWGTNLSMLPCDILTNVHKSCNPSHFLFACLKCDFASEHESQLRIHNSVHHEIHISNNTQYFSLCSSEVFWFSVVCCPMVRQLCLLWLNFYAPDTLQHHMAHNLGHHQGAGYIRYLYKQMWYGQSDMKAVLLHILHDNDLWHHITNDFLIIMRTADKASSYLFQLCFSHCQQLNI